MNNYEKRREQLKRYEASEVLDAQTVPKNKNPSPNCVRFPDNCVFLAACASRRTQDVDEILETSNTDINTSNIDGLTGLHLVCGVWIITPTRYFCHFGGD